jgi:hypothetical protein
VLVLVAGYISVEFDSDAAGAPPFIGAGMQLWKEIKTRDRTRSVHIDFDMVD